MKILIRLSIFILLILSFSCEKSFPFLVVCEDCITDEPTRAELQIKLTGQIYDLINISIYEGTLDDNILYGNINPGTDITYFSVPVNKRFTLTATYRHNGKTYTAVDSVLPRVKYDRNSCDDPCYFVYDNVVNLMLKYTE